MIIVKLIGGLGNQMFQYALGRHLATQNRTTLKIDITGFQTYKLHKYSLQHLNIDEQLATGWDLWPYSRWNLPLRLLDASRSYPRKRWIKERWVGFDPEVLKVGSPAYLEGYWQSEKYFQPLATQLRSELSVKTPPNGPNREMLRQIKKDNAVSLHIRRGDFVADATTNQVHGTCSLDYYRGGAAYIAERHPGPTFYVFSDDPAWVRENLRLDHPMVIVDLNDAATNYEDLRLMSSCRHHIIANSSFSWWGAWLNPDPGKVVIGPKVWFRSGTFDEKDLLPEEWIRL